MNITPALAIVGWMSEPELCWLAKQALTHSCIVEIGSYQGRSTRALADYTAGFVVAVDPWKYKMAHKRLCFEQFSHNLRDHIASRKVRPVRAKSEVCLPLLEEALGIHKPDMVFIDGNHEYEMVRHDIVLARSLLLPGGLLCGHDYGHPQLPGVKRAVDSLCTQVQTVDSIWWTLT